MRLSLQPSTSGVLILRPLQFGKLTLTGDFSASEFTPPRLPGDPKDVPVIPKYRPVISAIQTSLTPHGASPEQPEVGSSPPSAITFKPH